jgi:hypothetical protein
MSSNEQSTSSNNAEGKEAPSIQLGSLGGSVGAQAQGMANLALGMALNQQNTMAQMAAEEQKAKDQAAAAEI